MWEKVPAGGEVASIVMTLPAAATGGFQTWMRNSVKGGSSNERAGSLEYLGPGEGRPYFHLDMRGLGITRLSRTPQGTAKIEMYCEAISFSAEAAAFGN